MGPVLFSERPRPILNRTRPYIDYIFGDRHVGQRDVEEWSEAPAAERHAFPQTEEDPDQTDYHRDNGEDVGLHTIVLVEEAYP